MSEKAEKHTVAHLPVVSRFAVQTSARNMDCNKPTQLPSFTYHTHQAVVVFSKQHNLWNLQL